MQTFFVKYKVKDDSRESVRGWADFLNTHQEQVLESLRNEHIAFEFAALDMQADGLYLVYAMKAEDINKVFQTLESSKREVDVFQKEILPTLLGNPQKLDILINFENPDI